MERNSSEQELVSLKRASPISRAQVATIRSIHGRIYRPPSYSDSFFFMPPGIHAESTRPYHAIGENPIIVKTSICHIWSIRCISFCFHISLISIFETLFFFHFISQSEDSGIQGTIQKYIQGILSQCNGWSANETIIISDFLSLIMNTTQISLAASTAASDRLTHNGLLETQAWFYVTGIVVMLIAGTGVTLWNKMRIPWKRIIIENIIMVVLLGMYEIFFFKTIIYNYRSLTFEELNNNLITQLQNTCGVLTY